MNANRRWGSYRASSSWRHLFILMFMLMVPARASSPPGRISFGLLRQGIYQEASHHQDSGEEPTPAGTVSANPDATSSTIAILTVTPAADGSIIHVVETGQVLVNIAFAYQISLAEIYTMNGLNADSVIYPGDKIIIRLANVTPSPPATETALPTMTPLPAPTHRPTRTATQPASAPPVLTGAATGSPGTAQFTSPAQAQSSSPDLLLIVIGILVLIGAGLVVVGNLIKRRS